MTSEPPEIAAERAMVEGQEPVPEATTAPTDRREGERIQTCKAECPFCEKRGTMTMSVALCGGCGRWFEVSRP